MQSPLVQLNTMRFIYGLWQSYVAKGFYEKVDNAARIHTVIQGWSSSSLAVSLYAGSIFNMPCIKSFAESKQNFTLFLTHTTWTLTRTLDRIHKIKFNLQWKCLKMFPIASTSSPRFLTSCTKIYNTISRNVVVEIALTFITDTLPYRFISVQFGYIYCLNNLI